MPLFSSKLSYLGVDFDSHSVKVVELKNEKGRPRLITYGYFDHEIDYQPQKNKDNTNEIIQLINTTCQKANVSSKIVISSLPAFSVFSSIITLPNMSKKELAAAVKWEAKKVVPLSLEEVNLHWEVLEEEEEEEENEDKELTNAENKENQGLENGDEERSPENNNGKFKDFLHIRRKQTKNKNIKIFLTAAPKNLVKKYLEIFGGTNLSLLSLDTEAFALIRSLVGNDRSTTMIVSIDFSVTNVLITKNGIPFLNRSVNVGGLAITRAIANSLNVNLKRAEQFKYDIGIDSLSGDRSVPKTIEVALAPIIDEIRYSTNLYRNQGGDSIEKIILTGGSSLLLNLPEYISKNLNIRTFLGDPWARVIYPEELKPALSEIGPRFAVAIGLAMKEII